MAQKRDTRLYELRDHHQVVYYGISKNPKIRLADHSRKGWRFTHMNVIRGPMSRETAELLEYGYIVRYQMQHGNVPPRYNCNKTY